jgi:hypothetical protein
MSPHAATRKIMKGRTRGPALFHRILNVSMPPLADLHDEALIARPELINGP